MKIALRSLGDISGSTITVPSLLGVSPTLYSHIIGSVSETAGIYFNRVIGKHWLTHVPQMVMASTTQALLTGNGPGHQNLLK